MQKETFVQVLEAVVRGFEDPGFKSAMAAAKAAGDVGKLVQLPLEVQSRAFAAAGLDLETGAATFKAAGRAYATDPAVGPLLVRMKAALG
ncbi:MAG: hypothetical protein H6747_07180 [Deltaproteobacteria bacterium]|nr:hypothetical protein [Deltaproteobacteria bacterium]